MQRVRAIFLSDLHIGHAGLDAVAVVKFLKETDAKFVYLVGDIIDGWKLKKRWVWKPEYSAILDQLVEKHRRGAKIIYVPGNHDDELRRFSPFRLAQLVTLFKLRIQDVCIHKTADDKRLIVMHGDQFDNFLLRGRVSRWSDHVYDVFSDVFGIYGRAPRVKVGGRIRPFSLAKALVKRSGKTALKLMNNFERASKRLIKRKWADGIICGHTHVPKLKTLGNGKILGNCGMWAGSTNTALVEHEDGSMELIRYPDCRHEQLPPAILKRCRMETKMLIRAVQKIWNPEAAKTSRSLDAEDQPEALLAPEMDPLPNR